MGLDMYLNAKHFYWHNDEKPKLPEIPDGYELEEIQVQAAYWRKANQIHDWFVTEVQGGEDDCGSYFVSRDQLRTLRDLCKEVLEDKSKAAELLPTKSGFFFGGTEYDEWYFKDLEATVEQIDKVIEAFPEPKWYFEYRSSW